MTQAPDDLKRLAEILGEVKRRCPTLPVAALQWIQVKHPIHPVQEQLLKACESGEMDSDRGLADWRRLGRLVGLFGLSLGYALNLTLRLLKLKIKLKTHLQALKKRSFHLVAKSWSFPARGLDDGLDFYYGDLQRRLKERGVEMLLITGNPAGTGWSDLREAEACSHRPGQLLELCLVPWFAPLRVVFEQMGSSLRLYRIASQTRDPLVRRVFLRASEDGLSPSMAPINLYYWMGRTMVKLWHPSAVMTLYEGYAWEQCLWRGVKSVDPTCQTVGFQHTILLRHNLALLLPQENGSSWVGPDLVLCSGPRTESMLRSSHSRSELLPFGTFRRSAGAQALQKPCPLKRSVLVLPEGYPQEVKLLFTSALRAAERLGQYRFILRCHPAFPPEKVPALLQEDLGKFPNVRFSSGGTIEGDFSESSVILYRGSSSVLYAILQGLKPIYLNADRSREVDPLFELEEWRERANSVEELERLLRQYEAMDLERACRSWKGAVEYVESYTVPVDRSSIDRLLLKLGLRQGDARS